jgi:hypothetical protein
MKKLPWRDNRQNFTREAIESMRKDAKDGMLSNDIADKYQCSVHTVYNHCPGVITPNHGKGGKIGLSKEIREQVRKDYSTGLFTREQLAFKHNISYSTVAHATSDIDGKKKWISRETILGIQADWKEGLTIKQIMQKRGVSEGCVYRWRERELTEKNKTLSEKLLSKAKKVQLREMKKAFKRILDKAIDEYLRENPE